jgi:ribonuclease J
VIVALVKLKEKKILAGPDIFSRGFVYVKESEELMIESKKAATKIILECFEKPNCDWNMIKLEFRDLFYKFFYEKTKRNPLILPIVLEVKK